MRLHFALLIIFSCARTQIQLANETRKAKAERQRRWPLMPASERAEKRDSKRRVSGNQLWGPGCAARLI